MYYDDFYEPSEFEEQIEEWKDTLRQSVKKEFLDEMERLRKENATLTEIKNSWDEKTRELEKKIRELDRAIIDAKKEAKAATLHELLDPYTRQAWGFSYRSDYIREKCDKCDKYGYIHYKTPSGRDAREECVCRRKIATYSPVEAEIIEMRQWLPKRYKPKQLSVFFKYEQHPYRDEDEDVFCETANIYDGEDFETIKQWSGMIFLNKDDCQRYCDFLNKKERVRNGVENEECDG